MCGSGQTGEHIARELIATKRPFVLIEPRAERAELLPGMFGQFAWIGSVGTRPLVSPSNTPQSTRRGGVAGVRDNEDNLIINISARIINPKLRIVARCVDAQVQRELQQAAADAVVSPNRTGGLRMVSELVRPTAEQHN